MFTSYGLAFHSSTSILSDTSGTHAAVANRSMVVPVYFATEAKILYCRVTREVFGVSDFRYFNQPPSKFCMLSHYIFSFRDF